MAQSSKKKHSRTVSLPLPLQEDGTGQMRIAEGAKVDHYALQELETESGFRTFRCTKLSGSGEYTVEMGSRCECPGFGYTGHCKHLEALAALSAAGRLMTHEDAVEAAADAAALAEMDAVLSHWDS